MHYTSEVFFFAVMWTLIGNLKPPLKHYFGKGIILVKNQQLKMAKINNLVDRLMQNT